nr:ribosomal protein S9 [Cyanidioschyzonaceae sp. 2]
MYAIGKRKCAIARVWLVHGQRAAATVEKQTLEEYFQHNEEWIGEILEILKPLELRCEVKVKGGGLAAQADATALAIKRALHPHIAHFKLTRDARIKERRKYGLKKARKAPQYSKR